jgi:hypothetical protein
MHLIRFIIFSFVLFSASKLSFADTAQGLGLFDVLITKADIIREFESKKVMDFNVSTGSDGVRHFIAQYPFKRRTPAEHYAIDIAVAPMGHFLNPILYKQRRNVAMQGDSAQKADYPAIGYRAQREFFGVGPGGAAYGLTFTTSDERFDIRITISSLMPEGVEGPQFDVDRFAQHLSDRYNSEVKSCELKRR